MAPLFAAPFLPLTDIGFNGHAGLLPAVALGDDFLKQYYEVSWNPMPYWSAYALQGALSLLVGPVLAVKVMLATLIVALPLSFMRLALALDRDPRICLFAFLLVWDTNVYWGWLSFQLGMVVCLWVLARVVEADSYKRALWTWPGAALLGLSHPHAIVLTAVSGALLAFTRRPSAKGVLCRVLALSGTLLTLLPWIMRRVLENAPATKVAAYRVTNPPFAEKLQALYDYTLGNYVEPNAKAWAALAFASLLFAPAILGALPQRRVGVSVTTSAALFVGALGLYLGLPFEFWGQISHWWTYPRYATYVLLGALLLPRADLGGYRFFYLAPVAALAVGIHVASYRQFADFGKRTAAFAEIINFLPMHQRLYPISYSKRDPAVSGHSIIALHGYAAMAKQAYDPHLFAVKDIPLQYRKRLPQHNWSRPATFSFDRHGKYYDYILLYHATSNPLRKQLEQGLVRLAHQAGPWALYHVQDPVPYGD